MVLAVTPLLCSSRHNWKTSCKYLSSVLRVKSVPPSGFLGLLTQLVTFVIHTSFLKSTWECADKAQQCAEY